ncbi:MAG: type II toxin-antitoxin system RelE/ParE family toxin [Beijerinckiaceae bacterium]
MHGVLFTSTFERQAQQAGVTEAELEHIAMWIADNPLSGDVIPGSGGARKLRFAKKGGGKSGGYRTIHYFGGHDVPVFCLALLSKGQRANISQAERNELARILPKIAQAYKNNAAKLAVEGKVE